ncbi:MAG TPA: hypothetical protein VLI04_02000 [Nocardioidaceae bacterium]|nr:hypothetical protein [Nocardioidaceae bacterium]
MNDRGSGGIVALVILTVFAAIIAACLYMAAQADTQPLIEQVQQSFGGLL